MRRRVRRLAQRGMSLIEIMIVVAIMGMIIGTASVVYFQRLEKARITNTKILMKEIEKAVLAFRTENNDSCPKGIEDLVTQRYLNKKPQDPWGQGLTMVFPGQHDKDGIDLTSSGKDKQMGTQDDIHSWDQSN